MNTINIYKVVHYQHIRTKTSLLILTVIIYYKLIILINDRN